MQLDLTRYRQPLSAFARTFRPEELAHGEEAYRIVAPVWLDLEIHKDTDRFRLVGAVRTELELPCSRCLEPFRLPIDASFTLRYLPETDMATEPERELPEEELEVSFYRDDAIDLEELLREQFYLQLPMKPLCREGCLGLCPQCGTNLNTATCGCTVEWEDPRLAPLEALRRPARDS